jgi:hypothetical protein
VPPQNEGSLLFKRRSCSVCLASHSSSFVLFNAIQRGASMLAIVSKRCFRVLHEGYQDAVTRARLRCRAAAPKARPTAARSPRPCSPTPPPSSLSPPVRALSYSICRERSCNARPGQGWCSKNTLAISSASLSHTSVQVMLQPTSTSHTTNILKRQYPAMSAVLTSTASTLLRIRTYLRVCARPKAAPRGGRLAMQ